MNKQLVFGALTLAVVGVVGSGMYANAYWQDGQWKPGSNFSQERHDAMQKAFQNNDYDAWKNLMAGRGRMLEVINKDNFAQFAEMHRLMQEGKFDEAQKIRQDLGLGMKNGNGGRGGCGMARGAQNV